MAQIIDLVEVLLVGGIYGDDSNLLTDDRLILSKYILITYIPNLYHFCIFEHKLTISLLLIHAEAEH